MTPRKPPAKLVRKVRVECFECAVLPPNVRPATPRPIDERSGPRKPRCWTHMNAEVKRRQQVRRDRHQRNTYGLEPDDFEELYEFQGGFCPCGNRIKHRDHDHQLAKEHDHPEKQGCKLCMRGLLCASCNSTILGRGYNEVRLLALVEYLRNPPARQLWGPRLVEEAS